MERAGLTPPIRRASKRDFLRLITRRVPPSRWTKGKNKADRVALQRDILRLQSALKAEAMGVLPNAFKKVLEDQIDVFTQTALTLGVRTGLNRKAYKASDWTAEEIALGALLLRAASREAFGNYLALNRMARPVYQSLMDRAYARSRYLLGEADGLVNPMLANRNEKILRNLRDVQVSTKSMADFRIGKALESGILANASWGDAVAGVTASVAERIKSASRLTTFGRTESFIAVDEGIKEAAKISNSLTHMSVVGCRAIEPNIPTYMGTPTCNIENVPIQDVDIVQFHVNHTGAWFPSRFAV